MLRLWLQRTQRFIATIFRGKAARSEFTVQTSGAFDTR